MSGTSAGESSVIPFGATVDQSVLDGLADRLRRTRWADIPEAGGWDVGTSGELLRDPCDRWSDRSDGRAGPRLERTDASTGVARGRAGADRGTAPDRALTCQPAAPTSPPRSTSRGLNGV